ncbi:hypothetical protein RND81_01G152900 [Saponaria officinalis]|uniref:THO1-MOS11 C-terminal domain-containing protein n=1 Tax=Saponaria officinalis TaxID=3572 RepID=A0AAW1NG11_SAPOF
MATETQKSTPPNPEIEIPDKTLTLNPQTSVDLNQDSSNSKQNPNSSPNIENSANQNHRDDTKCTTTAVVSPTADDIQKKMKRAERFGVPVLLSEEDKRNSRSHRFGTGAGPEVSKSAEEQKRKARAERFGITVPADEEVKKKSRVEKFGSDTKVDNVEEEKRKARALRFSHPQTTDVSLTNGNGDSGSIATVDNANGGA